MNQAAAKAGNSESGVRLDKFLWACRFFKTRSLAADEIALGRVLVNGQSAKPAREVRVGDTLELVQGQQKKTVVVQALSGMRGPAPVAQLLYAETAESAAQRQKAQEARRLAPEPAAARAAGRPTKRDRRALSEAESSSAPDWGARWSVSTSHKV